MRDKQDRRSVDALQAQLRLARTLQKVGTLLTTHMSLDEVLEQLFDLLAQVIDYDSVSVQLLNESGGVDLVAWRGFANVEKAAQIAEIVVEQRWEQRFGQNKVVVIPDTYADPDWVPGMGHEYIRSWIGAALQVRGAFLGVLNVDSTVANAYDEASGEMVLAFANQAAIAIENVRMFVRQKRIQAALRESEARYRAVVEDQTELLCRTRPDGTLTFVNQAYCRFFKKSPEQLLGKNYRDLVFDKARTAGVRFSFTPEKPVRVRERRVVDGNGEMRWLEWTDRALFDESGHVAEFQSVGRDVTERKRAEEALQQHQVHLEGLVKERTAELGRAVEQLEQEVTERVRVTEALRESERRFRSIAETASDAIIIFNRHEIIFFWNQAAKTIFGYESGETQGKLLDSIVTREFASAIRQAIQQVVSGAESDLVGKAIEMIGVRKDGSEFPLELSLAVWRTRENLFLTAIARDVTERKRAEKALQESEEKFRAISTSAQEAIILVDNQGKISYWNRAAEGIFGYTEQEVLNRELHGFLVPQRYYRTYRKGFEKFRETGEGALVGRIVEFMALKKDKTEFPLAFSLSSVRIGDKWNAVCIARDVTERKRVERELRQAKEAAEAARYKEQERRQEAELRRRVAEGLADVLAALNSNQPVNQVLGFIAVQAERLLECQAVVIYSLRCETETLKRGSALELPIDHVVGVDLPLGRQMLRQVVASRRPVAVSDVDMVVYDDGDLAPAYQALLTVPIMVQDKVCGSISLYYVEPRAFSGDQVELALVFGDQVALALENARLREQVQQAAATAERNRLARDLHDAVTQTLFSASLIAEAIPRIWAHDPKEGQKGLEELRQLTRGALAEMRTMLLELRPAALTEKPLGELFRHLTEAMVSRTRVPVSLAVEGNSALPPQVQIALYRIAQEALNNVAKHAGASQASVSLRCQPEAITLCIEDDGAGFDPDAVLPDRLGVSIMRERAESVGAVLEIESRPGHGTQVVVDWQDRQAERERLSND